MLILNRVQAPQSFQPPIPAAASTPASSRPNNSASNKSAHADLITRYKLQSKVDQAATPPAPESESSQASRAKEGWSQNKAERQALFKRRQEEMILKARRKIEDKDKAAKA